MRLRIVFNVVKQKSIPIFLLRKKESFPLGYQIALVNYILNTIQNQHNIVIIAKKSPNFLELILQF